MAASKSLELVFLKVRLKRGLVGEGLGLDAMLISFHVHCKDSVVPFEEDYTHEFKGHRNLSIEDLPRWCYIPGTDRRSRKAVSRNINAFLNTGKGGTVYLGIVDEGKVKGLQLTQYQKDHVTVGMMDLMGRYKPVVKEDRYKVEFVPVLSQGETDFQVEELLSTCNGSDIDTQRLASHVLRTPKYCWCDRDAETRFQQGRSIQEYVIEITVFPWEDKMVEDQQGHYRLALHPVYEDELGDCYFRRTASLIKYTRQEVIEFTKDEVQSHFKPVLLRLKEEVLALGREISQL